MFRVRIPIRRAWKALGWALRGCRSHPWRVIMGLRRSNLAAVAVLALAGATVSAVQNAPAKPSTPDHLVGVWSVNLAKSRYFPGPAPTSETRTYTREGDSVVGVIQRAFRDGRRERIEYTANYDREYPVMGTENYDHVVLKRIDEYTSEAVLSHAGRVYGTARRVIANDGKTMTITFRRENQSGPSVYNVAVYDRIATVPGEPQ
jgi:hypothetical protein